MIQHTIQWMGETDISTRLSFQAVGVLSNSLTDVAQRVLRLRVENRSNLQSKPEWLSAATRIEIVDVVQNGTALICAVPTLEEAAPTLFDQLAFWEARPRKEQSVLSLVEETLRDAAGGNTESDLLDRNTLSSVTSFREFLNLGYRSFSLDGSAEDAPQVQVTPAVLARVELLRETAPQPQRVVIAGTLDEMAKSKRAFRLLLTNGTSVRGVLPPGDVARFRDMLGEFVVVDGEAAFRLSGKVALVTATNIQLATEQDRVFENLPRPRPRSVEELQPRIRPYSGTSGMENVFGRWPGEESDEEILAALKGMK